MAGVANNNNPNDHSLYLSPTQQDLLLAALSSNNPKGNLAQSAEQKSPFEMDLGGNFPAAGQHFDPLAFDGVNYEESPYIDPLDVDGSFDYGFDPSMSMIGPLPGEDYEDSPIERDSHDKRKNPSDEPEDGLDEGNKRHEPEEKTAKKPGRKPLTSEPTTVSQEFHNPTDNANNTQRSGRRRIARHSAHSVSGRRSI